MSQKTIAVVVGSLRKDSINRHIAKTLGALAPSGYAFKLLEIGDLPLYNQDDDEHQAAPVKRLKSEIRAAAGVVFVTPEYNRSIPGVLKNAIDHASRPYGDSAWGGKPAGIVGGSIGAVGTAAAQQHLRSILGYLDMPTLGQPEVFLHVKEGFFKDDGSVADEGSRQFLQGWVDRFIAWVDRHAA